MTRSRDIADQQKNLGGAVAPFVGSKNFVINGGFDHWQRGTSFNSQGGLGAPAYTADRYQFYRGSGATGATMSRVATNDTTNLPNIQYAARLQRNSGNTATDNVYLFQSFETANSIPLVGKLVTLSFYARAGANFSATSNFLNTQVASGTGTDQNILSGFTGNTSVISQNAILTTIWQRFSYTGIVSSSATQLGLYFAYTPTGTAGANDYFEITGVQLEIGSVATPFSRAGGTIGGELALCQRYYWRATGGSGTGNPMMINGMGQTTTIADFFTQFPVQMRTSPTSIDYTNLGAYDVRTTVVSSGGTWALLNGLTYGANIRYTHGSSVFATNDIMMLVSATSGATYLGFNAEL